ncbi:tripartite tricarboxylate transporter substrate binding protein [Comamonadaceae bacterium G21597-S1]|nr:tripartite tricarboxylate transporter substrate binding protein [Comamonadaceae bacterium G21597-S1]
MHLLTRIARSLGAIAAIASMAIAMPAQAAFPEKPITIVVPFSPGGTTDLAARLVAEMLNKATGATVLVENKPGAGGMLGIQHVAKANPDGYTVLFGSDSLIIQPLVNKNATATLDDFLPLVRVRTTGNYLAVGAAVPASNVKELVALAKAKPGQIRYATGGAGSVLHLAGEAFADAAGIKLVHVPYKGAAPATTDAVGGHVEMVWAGSSDFAPYAKSGQLKVIAQTGTRRSLAMPDVPTMTEAGLADVVVVNWNGVLAPKGTPADAAQWLTDKIAAVVTTPEYYTRGKILAIEPGDMIKGQAFADMLKDARARTKKIVETSKIDLTN